MVDTEEVRHRLKEKIKERYPKAEMRVVGENLVVKFDKDHKSTFYPHKIMAEMNEVSPTEWDEIVDKRVRSIPLGENRPKIIRLVPRIYSKSALHNEAGDPFTREELDKAGITVLKELKNEWVILAAETEAAYMSLPEKEILKQMSKREYKVQVARAKKLLDLIL